MYAIDVYCHQSCYITFALNPVFEEDKRNCLKEQQKYNILDEFYCYIRKNILKNKQAYILHNLLNDIKANSTENGLQESVIGFTSVLRTKLEVTFEDQLGYCPSGIYVIVYSLYVN